MRLVISPWTKPGTKVVCIDTVAAAQDFSALFWALAGCNLPPIPCARGAIYTVRSIRPTENLLPKFAVELDEFPGQFFLLRFFRPAELPRSLTEILDRAPVLEKELVS